MTVKEEKRRLDSSPKGTEPTKNKKSGQESEEYSYDYEYESSKEDKAEKKDQPAETKTGAAPAIKKETGPKARAQVADVDKAVPAQGSAVAPAADAARTQADRRTFAFQQLLRTALEEAAKLDD